MQMISQTLRFLKMRLRNACQPQICLSSVITKTREKSLLSVSLNSSRSLSTNSSIASSLRLLQGSPLSHKPRTIRTWKLRLKNSSRCFNSSRSKWRTSGKLLLTNRMSMLKLCQHLCKHITLNRTAPYCLTNYARFKPSTTMLISTSLKGSQKTRKLDSVLFQIPMIESWQRNNSKSTLYKSLSNQVRLLVTSNLMVSWRYFKLTSRIWEQGSNRQIRRSRRGLKMQLKDLL